MTDYYLAGDGFNHPTIWRHNPDRPNYPQPVLSQWDFRKCPELWDLITAAVPQEKP